MEVLTEWEKSWTDEMNHQDIGVLSDEGAVVALERHHAAWVFANWIRNRHTIAEDFHSV